MNFKEDKELNKEIIKQLEKSIKEAKEIGRASCRERV